MSTVYLLASFGAAMGPANRVVVHDKQPLFDPDMFLRPLNRVVPGVAGCSLFIQIAGLIQVILHPGDGLSWFDHVGFAVVAFLWLALGVLVFLQRRVGSEGRLFLLSASAGSIFLGLSTVNTLSLAD